MPTSRVYVDAAARLLVLERCVALHATVKNHRRSISQILSFPQLASKTLSARSFPLSLQCGPRILLPISCERAVKGARSYTSGISSSTDARQGTIGKVAEGVVEEAGRLTEGLRAPDHLNEKEKVIFEKLDSALDPIKLEVQDISGGCGSMYGIEIVSERFRGLSMLKQQRMVNKVLGEDIKGWHGVQLKTRAP